MKVLKALCVLIFLPVIIIVCVIGGIYEVTRDMMQDAYDLLWG